MTTEEYNEMMGDHDCREDECVDSTKYDKVDPNRELEPKVSGKFRNKMSHLKPKKKKRK